MQATNTYEVLGEVKIVSLQQIRDILCAPSTLFFWIQSKGCQIAMLLGVHGRCHTASEQQYLYG